jgi:hypothetical protein
MQLMRTGPGSKFDQAQIKLHMILHRNWLNGERQRKPKEDNVERKMTDGYSRNIAQCRIPVQCADPRALQELRDPG